jgi:hypothetical protein
MAVTDFDVIVYGDSKTVFQVRSSGAFSGRQSTLLATVTVPAGALVRASLADGPGADPSPSLYASTSHTLRVRSIPTSEVVLASGGDALLSAAYRVDVVPALRRPLAADDYITFDVPVRAVAALLSDKRDLCLANLDRGNSVWRCFAKLKLSTRDGLPGAVTGNETLDANLVWRVQLPTLGVIGVRFEPPGPIDTAVMISLPPLSSLGEPDGNEFVVALATALGVAAFVCFSFALIGGVFAFVAVRRKRALRQKRDMQRMARAAAEADVVAGVPSGGASDRFMLERQRMVAANVSPLLMSAVDFLMMKGVFLRGIFADEPRSGSPVARKAEALFSQWHNRGGDGGTESEHGRSSHDDVPASGDSDRSSKRELDLIFAGAGGDAPPSPRSTTLTKVPDFPSDTDPQVIAQVVRLYFRSLHPDSIFGDQFFRLIDRIPEYRAAPAPVLISSVLLATEMTSSYDGSERNGVSEDSDESSAESARSATGDDSPRAATAAQSVASMAALPPLNRGMSRIDLLGSAVQSLDERAFLTLRLICNLLYQIHSNASINGMTAGDLQQALYAVLLPPSKGDFKPVIGDLIANFEYVFGTDSTDDDETASDENKVSTDDASSDLLAFHSDDGDDNDDDVHVSSGSDFN